MIFIPNRFIGAQCEVKDKENKIITTGKLKKIGEDFIEISNDFHVMSLRKYDEGIKIEIRNGVDASMVVEGRVYLPNENSFRVVDMTCLSDEEGREFFRVTINDKAVLTKKTLSGVKGMDFEVTIIDLSLGGALIHSGLAFEVGKSVILGITLVNGSKEYFDAVIVRSVPAKKPGFCYGVKFMNLNPQKADILCRHLFLKQKDIISVLKQ